VATPEQLSSTQERLSLDHWEGNQVKDGGPYTEYPDYDGGTVRFAREVGMTAYQDVGIHGETLASFEAGNIFDADQYPEGTVVRISQDSLLGPLSNHAVLFEKVFLAVICKSKDKDPRYPTLLIGFNTYTTIDMENNRVESINFGHSEQPFPASFRIGEVWRDQLDTEGLADELRKVTKVDVMMLGRADRKRATRRRFERSRVPGFNPFPIPHKES